MNRQEGRSDRGTNPSISLSVCIRQGKRILLHLLRTRQSFFDSQPASKQTRRTIGTRLGHRLTPPASVVDGDPIIHQPAGRRVKLEFSSDSDNSHIRFVVRTTRDMTVGKGDIGIASDRVTISVGLV